MSELKRGIINAQSLTQRSFIQVPSDEKPCDERRTSPLSVTQYTLPDAITGNISLYVTKNK